MWFQGGNDGGIARGMGPERAAEFVKEICAGDMHAARAASLANAVTGALASAALGMAEVTRSSWTAFNFCSYSAAATCDPNNLQDISMGDSATLARSRASGAAP